MWRVMALVLVLGGNLSAWADEEGRLAAAPDWQQIVERSARQFTEAFNQSDAAAIARLFTAEAEYVDAAGTIFHGQAAIQSEFAAAFAVNSPGTMQIQLVSIRPIAAGVMVEDGVSSFSPEEGGPTTQTFYTATHVKQADGGWLIASIRELEAEKMTPHDRLLALGWLQGAWHEDVKGSVIRSRWKWSEDGNYLLSEFSVQQSAQIDSTGSHRIGWDAERKQFRSWIFESSGGTAEGWWRPNADGSWSVHLSGVDAAGNRRSAVMTYAREGSNAIVVTQDQRIVAGQSLPDTVHRVVRQPPAVQVLNSATE